MKGKKGRKQKNPLKSSQFRRGTARRDVYSIIPIILIIIARVTPFR
jgi:hypothetical protein